MFSFVLLEVFKFYLSECFKGVSVFPSPSTNIRCPCPLPYLFILSHSSSGAAQHGATWARRRIRARQPCWHWPVSWRETTAGGQLAPLQRLTPPTGSPSGTASLPKVPGLLHFLYLLLRRNQGHGCLLEPISALIGEGRVHPGQIANSLLSHTQTQERKQKTVNRTSADTGWTCQHHRKVQELKLRACWEAAALTIASKRDFK